MRTLRGLALVAVAIANLAFAKRFGQSNWFVLLGSSTVILAWFVGLLDGSADSSSASQGDE